MYIVSKLMEIKGKAAYLDKIAYAASEGVQLKCLGLKFLPGTVVCECVRYSMHAAPVPCPNRVTF